MSSARRLSCPISFLVAMVLLLLPAVCRADGFIVIDDGPPVVGHFRFAPLEVVYHRVNVEIDDQVAVTSVDQAFHNPNSRQMEGTYIFPLPAGAHIDRFQMDINGQMMQAELLPAEKARELYEEIVRKYRDPALLEYVGRDALKVRIFPIEPRAQKVIKLQYTQLLKSDSDLTEYAYPLNTEKFSARPLKDLSVKVTLRCTEPLRSIYSPSHDVETKRDGDNKAVVGFEQHNVRPDADFKLVWSNQKSPIGVNLLSYRSGPEDGYFLLLATPGIESGPVQQKDIAFVLDTSGSMAQGKLDQAKKALAFCLENLNEGDRFEVVRFSTEAELLFRELRPATRENISQAQAYLRTLKPTGGTAIDDALQKSLKLDRGDSAGRPYVIIFLTDGQPTVGETREDPIVDRIRKGGQDIRVFSFGIGTDVNTHLLDRIAETTRGFSQYVLPQEDIEVKVSSFYTKIKEPALTNVEVAFEGSDVKVSQLYPGTMPDLFKGEMLVVFGRYAGAGPAAVRIGGTLNGEQRRVTADVQFVADDATHGFIPRLWATRRVGWLLDEIRMHGESAELKDEVVRLAREHGIVTPYTAYLILEDEQRRGVPIASRSFRDLEEDRAGVAAAKELYDYARADSGRQVKAGDVAVQNAQNVGKLKHNTSMDQIAQNDALARSAPATPGGGGAAGPLNAEGYRNATNYVQQVRVVNGRAFYQNASVWQDSAVQAKPNLKRQQVKFNSDEYFALLRRHPHAGAWLALGEQVDLVLGDTIYEVR